ESAAGAAGLMKAVLALQHETIPRPLHLSTLNPRIFLEGTCLSIATSEGAWPQGSVPRRAGGSSFGLSGTNSHVILEEALRERSLNVRHRRGVCWRCQPRATAPYGRWQGVTPSASNARGPRLSPTCATPRRSGGATSTNG